MELRVSRASPVLAIAALALLGWASTAARAASYTVWSCRGPDGAPISTTAWSVVGNDDAAADSCAVGGSLDARLLQSDGEPGQVRGYRFALAPGTSIAGYRIYLHAATDDRFTETALQAGVDDDQDLLGLVDAGCPVVNCTFGSLAVPLSAANLIAKSGLDGQALTVAAVCARTQGCYQASQNRLLAEVNLFSSEVDVRDDEAPVLLEPTGLPGSGQVLSSDSTVPAGASDRGGGVTALELLVDGLEVSRHDAQGTCSQPYSQATPCPGALTAALPLELPSVGFGLHTASVRAVDAAGNTTTSPAFSFTAVPASATLSSSASGTVERLVQVPAATVFQRVRIRASRDVIRLPDKAGGIAGAVNDAAGRPVAGAKVSVRSVPFGVRRPKPRLERTLTTDARGRFRAPAGLTSRLVILDVNEPGRRAAQPAEVRVMLPLRISARSMRRALRNGSTLTLRASVTGAGAGAAGKAILVQAFVGGRWTTVDSLAAAGDGRVVWRYKFRATTRRTVYLFRVKVERAGDVWPWPTAASRPVRVAVMP